ncbi:unnamed protein product [Clonostachys byssicola]|uniref:FAD-binding domain-containing protein n=1 Tax=Clonostachys byssicola TaxID=160290 RepID=A0A9N9U8D2_9HYPO|nr:unnamed protein product [Clonostachys byssicola]
MSHPSSTQPLRIGIIGAGISGLTNYIALSELDNVQINIYEQAQELKEIGASIGLGPNGLRGLQRLGVHAALNDSVGIRNHSTWPMIYRHWKTNAVLGYDTHQDVPNRLHHTARFHRAHLQKVLLDAVPKTVLHLKKRSVGLEPNHNSVTINFEDGSSVTQDLVIVSDGIHSAIRQQLLPDHKNFLTGWTSFRAVYDVSLLERFRDSQEVEIPTEALHYDWTPTVRALIETAPSVRSYPGHSGSIARQWVFNSRIVLTGDAAHPIGHAGFGAGMAIDDALALYMTLERIQLGSETKGTDLENALNLFQRVRKPHADRLGVFLARTGKAKSIYGKHLSEEQILEWVNGREDTAWIHEHDVNAAFGLVNNVPQ